jgi:stearoyl-CoA desaturase (delta-9 desaturase)
LIVGMGFVFPTVVAGLGWGDWRGGFFFAGAGGNSWWKLW